MNKSVFRALLVALLLHVALGSMAIAADCDAVLVPTKEDAKSDHLLEQSYLKIIDQSAYEQRKTGGTAGLSLPIVDALINASANWDDFQERRSAYFRKEQFNYLENDSRSYLRTYLPDKAIDAWVKCKTGKSGLALVARSVSRDSFVLRIDWKAPQGVGDSNVHVRVVGGTINDQLSITAPVKGSYEQSFIVRRNRNSDVTVIANVLGYTDDLIVRNTPSITAVREKYKWVDVGTVQAHIINGSCLNKNFCQTIVRCTAANVGEKIYKYPDAEIHYVEPFQGKTINFFEDGSVAQVCGEAQCGEDKEPVRDATVFRCQAVK